MSSQAGMRSALAIPRLAEIIPIRSLSQDAICTQAVTRYEFRHQR